MHLSTNLQTNPKVVRKFVYKPSFFVYKCGYFCRQGGRTGDPAAQISGSKCQDPADKKEGPFQKLFEEKQFKNKKEDATNAEENLKIMD